MQNDWTQEPSGFAVDKGAEMRAKAESRGPEPMPELVSKLTF